MGIFSNKYPYTDFHELNLDWFLSQFKSLTDDWDTFKTTITAEWNEMKENFTSLNEAVTALAAFINNYFDNLDVQDEINNKLDAMLEDGTLQTIVENSFKTYRPLALSIHEAPYISVNHDDNIFYGAGSCVYIPSENKLIVESDTTLNQNNSQKFDILNLSDETITHVYQNVAGAHTGGMCLHKGNIYDLVGTTKVLKYHDFVMSEYTTVTPAVTLNGLTSDGDKLIGMTYSNNHVIIYELSDDLQTSEVLNEFDMINSTANWVYQSFKYAAGSLYIVCSNSLIKIDPVTYNPVMQLTSLLVEGEYEDICEIKGNIYILINCGNTSPSYAIASSNLNANQIVNTQMFAFHKVLYVNSSRSGFYEDGMTANTAIHSSVWGSFYARSYAFNEIRLSGNSGALNLSSCQLKVNFGGFKACIINPLNSKLWLYNGTMTAKPNNFDSGEIINPNHCDITLDSIIIEGAPWFNGCNVTFKGNNTTGSAVFDTCLLKANRAKITALSFIDSDTGFTTGETYTSPLINGQRVQIMGYGQLCFEIAATRGGDIIGYATGASSNSHDRTVFAAGVTSSGDSIFIHFTDNKVEKCKINGVDAYIRKVYPLGY